MEIGERVSTIRNADVDTVYTFGLGVYEGDFIPDPSLRGIAGLLGEMKKSNPRIKLDSGEVVYGCECYWAPEAYLLNEFGTRRFVQVSIVEYRVSLPEPQSNLRSSRSEL